MAKKDEIKQKIARVYPQLTSDEIGEVETTLRNYLAIVRRIFEHVSRHNRKLLTELSKRAKVRKSSKKALR